MNTPAYTTHRRDNAIYRTVYGIHFEDADGNELLELVYPTQELRDEALEKRRELAPEGAVICHSWKGDQWVRDLVYGVEYGKGSLKHRFGGGYVPRNLYRYHRG